MKIYPFIFSLSVAVMACKSDNSTPVTPTPQPTSGQAGMAFSIASTGQTYGKAICTDPSDNFIVGTLFQGAMPARNLSPVGAIDMHLAKYDKNGTLLWERTAGGAGALTVPHGVVADAQGNIYVTGYTGADNAPGSLTATFGNKTVATKSDYDVFLAKYDPNGTALWVIGLGNTTGITEERAWDVAVDASGNAYITGAFSGTMDVNPLGQARLLITSATASGLFLAKYDTNGQNLFAIKADANLTGVLTEAYATVDVDQTGIVLWAGNFRGQARFSTTTLTSAGQTDGFIGSFRPTDGSINWLQRFGGTGQDIISPGAMRVNARNEIYLTGRFAGTMPIGGTLLSSQSAGNIFVASFAADGTYKLSFSLPGSTGLSGGHRIDFDTQNNVYVAGWFRNTVNFNPKGSLLLSANGTADAGDAFLAKYTSDGTYLWAKNFGATIAGSDNLAIAAGLATDKQGNALITGQFFGSEADFDPDTQKKLSLSSIGQNDCFVGKYTPDGALWTK